MNLNADPSAYSQGTILDKMEDEGYTSPSGEDFRYNPTLDSLNSTPKDYTANRSNNNDDFDDPIDWEFIAKLPYVENRHLTWDDIQVPFPYRFQKNLSFPSAISSKKLRKKSSIPYLFDSTEKGNEVLNAIWRTGDFEDNKVNENVVATIAENNASVFVTETEKIVTCEAVIKELKTSQEKPYYISLKEFIHHSLHLLAGRGSKTFYFDENIMCYKKNPAVLLKGLGPTTLTRFCQILLDCGTLVRKLYRISRLQDVFVVARCNGRESNIVYDTCIEFVSNYLKLYHTIMMLRGLSIKTLTKLNSFIQPLYQQLKTLEYVVDFLNISNSLELITELNRFLLCQETVHIQDLLRSLFLACISSYTKYVSDWIFRGHLGNNSEFHIERGREYTYTDRRFWTKQFVQKTCIPMFLENSAQLILETGKSMMLLDRIQPMMSKSSQLFCYDSDAIIKPHLTFKSLKQLTDLWQNKQNNFFKENCVLIAALESSIQTACADALNVEKIDFSQVEETREECRQKIESARIKFNQEQQIKKRELMIDMQEQVQLAIERKSQDTDLPLVEQRKLKRCLAENRKSFICDEKKTNEKLVESHVAVQGDVVSVPNPPLQVALNIIGGGDSESVLLNLNSSSINEVTKCNEDGNKSFVTSSVIDNENEEKFNPDKVIVGDHPEYKSDYSRELSQTLIIPKQGDEHSYAASNEFVSMKYDPHCLNYFLSQSVMIPLLVQNRLTNVSLLHHFIVENNLFGHISTLNSFLCLQNGIFSHSLSTMLIQEVSKGNIKSIDDMKTSKINIILSNALAVAFEGNEHDSLINNLSLTIMMEENTNAKPDRHKTSKEQSKYSPLNSIRLKYSVGWPLNIILTDDLLANFERIFVFLMQILRAEILLDRVFSAIKFKIASRQLDAIHYCRYRMLHFVRTVRNYVNVTVIDTSWTDLCGSFRKMNSLDTMYDGLVKHIKAICTNCLHGAKAERLLKLLTDQLVIIENFCDRLEDAGRDIDWENGEEMPLAAFTKLIQTFMAAEQIGKVFMNVAYKMVQKGYYPKVDYFLKLYNFNEYFLQDILLVSSYEERK